MSYQFDIRKKANKWTDARAKIILEVLSEYESQIFRHLGFIGRITLGAMRVVKYFSYEVPFLNRK